MNGRVHIMGANSPDPFALYDKIPVRNNTSYNDAMQGNWSQTALSKAFLWRSQCSWEERQLLGPLM